MTTRPLSIFWTAALFAVAGSAAHGADSAPASAPPPADPSQAKYTNFVAAIVNGKIITSSQLTKQMDPLVENIHNELQAKYPDDPQAATQEFRTRLQSLEAELLDNMINRILIIQKFHDDGVSIPQHYLDSVFEDSITSRFKGDHEAYLRFLQANNETESDYRQQLEDDQIVEYERTQLRGSVTGISPDRIKAYYDKNQGSFFVKEAVKVRQITLKPTAEETTDLLLQTAAKYVQEARQPGTSFEELAKQHSQDAFRDNGGLPPFLYYRDDKNKLPPKLEEAVFQLKPGEVSDPVVNDGTVFIFKCEEKISEGVLPLEKVRAQIEDTLAQQDSRDAVGKWIAKLREKAYIKNYLVNK